MKSVLIQHDYWYVTSGATKRTTENATAYDKADQKALALIMLSVKASQLMHIKNSESANSAWKKLESTYKQVGPARKVTLFKKLVYAKAIDGQSMKEHVDMFTDVIEKLSEMDIKIPEEVTSIILLCSLPCSYENFVIAIESRDALPSLEALKLKIIEEEQRRNNFQESSSDGVFYTAGKTKNDEKKYRDVKCYRCGKPGHKSFQCKKNKAQSKNMPPGKKIDKNNSEAARNAFIANVGTESDKCWYLDSGASSHMTPHENILENIRSTDVNDVTTANSSKMMVKNLGNANIILDGNEVEVKNVLHVPDLMVNLLSISKITEQGNKIIFDNKGASIFNKSNECLVKCKPQNGIYKLSESETSFLSKSEDTALIWHRRLGHINFRTLCEMRDANIGIQFKDSDLEITNCRICCEAKQHREPFKKSESKTKASLDLIHSDLVGPMENLSLGKAKYLLTFVDDYSRKIFPYFLHSKNQVFNTFQEFKSMAELQTDNKIKILRTDNGSEYMSKDFESYLKKCGIQHQLTNVYTPQQNGVAERFNRTVIERAKCLLFDAELPKTYWAEATNMATYLINKSISSVHKKIPDELYFNSKVDLSNLKIFGTTVMVHTPQEKRRKWDKKSQKMIFVGYDQNTKGYRCINRSNGKLTISRDVKFQESSAPKFIAPMTLEEVKGPEIVESPKGITGESEENIVGVKMGETSPIEITSDDSSIDGDNTKDLDYEPEETVIPSPISRSTRSQASRWPRLFSNLTCSMSSNSSSSPICEPQSLEELASRSDAQEWHSAIEEELSSLEENKTWELTELPKGKKLIKTKWVFKVKRDGDGEITRYKARLVAKGYTQRAGVDYEETYAPVVRYSSIRFLMALAVKHGLKIYQMDAVSAFLQGDIDEDIFIEQPEGYSDGTKRVCKLKRAIYGLKQASRQWNKKLDAALESFGLQKSKLDPCIYYTEDLSLILAIYVDDMMIFWRDEATLEKIKSSLSAKFRMKDIGVAKSCVGMKITQTDSAIELDQTAYVHEILSRFGMQDCKKVGTPSEMNLKMSKTIEDEENCLDVPYQQVVGCLLYLAQCTRPDLAFSVNDVSRFNSRHGKIHWNAVKRILRYLQGTADFKLRYERNNNVKIEGFCDADWASDIDNRRSCTGYIFRLSNGAISWGSKRQQTIALSSTEAEYMAMSSAVQEAMWLEQLAKELDRELNKPIKIFCDNQSTIKLSESDAYRPRTKHIDIRHHFVREMVSKEKVEINFISSAGNVADSLTKPVTREKFMFCADQMGLRQNQQ